MIKKEQKTDKLRTLNSSISDNSFIQKLQSSNQTSQFQQQAATELKRKFTIDERPVKFKHSVRQFQSLIDDEVIKLKENPTVTSDLQQLQLLQIKQQLDQYFEPQTYFDAEVEHEPQKVENSLLFGDEPVVQKQQTFGVYALQAFYRQSGVKVVVCPQKFLSLIFTDHILYKVPVVDYKLELANLIKLDFNEYFEHFLIKGLGVFEYNVCYLMLGYAMKFLYKNFLEQHPFQVTKISYLLPISASTFELQLYSKIKQPTFNNQTEKFQPNMAFILVEFLINGVTQKHQVGVVAVPVINFKFQLPYANEITTMKNGTRKVEFDFQGIVQVFNKWVDVVIKLLK